MSYPLVYIQCVILWLSVYNMPFIISDALVSGNIRYFFLWIECDIADLCLVFVKEINCAEGDTGPDCFEEVSSIQVHTISIKIGVRHRDNHRKNI